MDCIKMGALIRTLRKEKGMTQLELANAIQVSDKTISKWERGAGYPDVTLLSAVARALQVDPEKMLEGELSPNRENGGNMKRIQFYICPTCGNLLTATGDAEVTCCGRRIAHLLAKPSDEAHCMSVTPMEDEYYITFPHEMQKEHYIQFVAYASYDRVLVVRLYPEQGSELRIPQMRGGKLCFCCSQHGLFVNK